MVSIPRASSPTTTALNKVKRSDQRGFTIWHGLNRRGWQKTRQLMIGSPDGYRLRHSILAAMSSLNSWHEFWEEAIYGSRVDAVELKHSPVFILGHWRSGTTLLHDLLALDPRFTYPNLYQVMFPGHFLLTEHAVAGLTSGLLPKTRPMDNMTVRWEGSQEDEIALLLRTQLSPYNMLLAQGHPEEYRRYFDLTELSAEELSLWKREFLRFLKKLTLRHDKPIVLKSPSHTFRVPLLLELFPDARFVYLYRDPYAVYSSSMHLRRTMFTENALSTPNFEGLEEDMLWTYNHCIQRYESTKDLIPAGRLHELRFEDLEADPVEAMRKLYAALAFSGWNQVESRIQSELTRLTAYKKNAFSLDPSTMNRVYQSCRFAFATYGYSSRRDAPPIPGLRDRMSRETMPVRS